MNTNNRPVLAGSWGPAAWELYVSDQQPAPELCTAVGCVAIVDIDTLTVAMTRNDRSQDSWEIPAGHIEPGELPLDTAYRETLEETGFLISSAEIFAYREITWSIEADPAQMTERELSYPETSYLPYYFAFTDQERVAPTGHEVAETRDFTLYELRDMATRHTVHRDEVSIIELGLAAAAATEHLERWKMQL